MVNRLVLPKRPHSYHGETVSIKTGCGTIFVTVSVDDTGYPIETFARGKGGCLSISLEALGKTASVFLRIGGDAQELINQYQNMICPSIGWDNGVKVSSCAAALGIVLKEVLDKFNSRKSEPLPHAVDSMPQPTVAHSTANVDHSIASVDHAMDSDEDSPYVVDGGGVVEDDEEARHALSVIQEQIAERERLGLR